MKLIEYVVNLQTLLRKYGDIDVKYCTTYDFDLENKENREEYDESFEPYYNNNEKCIIVHNEFKRVDE